MTSPQLLLENLEKSLKEWEIFGRRAQLEAIMPVVDSITQHKVGCTVLARMLAERNFEIKPDTLRQSLHRWRAKQKGSTSNSPSEAPAGAWHGQKIAQADDDITASKIVDKDNQTPGNAALTKDGLRSIREQHVDLEAIIKAGRKASSNRY